MAGGSVEVRFVQDLVERAPNLAPLLDDHLNHYEELLPHVFIGDVTRFMGGAIDRGDPTADLALGILEQAFASASEPAQELIGVSFIENLDRTAPNSKRINERLGAALLSELRRQDNWSP